jgi:AraC family transcriptional regulator
MKLEQGKYLGETILQKSQHGLLLTLSKYAPSRTQPWHVHANPTLCYLIRGDHHDQVRIANFDQRPMTMVFHPTSEPHAGIVGPRGMLGLNVEYEAGWLERHELSERDLGGHQPLNSVWSQLGALRLLAGAFREDKHTEAELDSNAFELLIPLIKRMFRREKLTRPGWLRRAEEFIHDSFRSPLRVHQIAREVRVHPVHLARVFRQHHGCSVSEYIRALRIAEAGRFILGREQPIAWAACESGFVDQAHLSRWFSRTLGFSPKILHSAGKALQV